LLQAAGEVKSAARLIAASVSIPAEGLGRLSVLRIEAEPTSNSRAMIRRIDLAGTQAPHCQVKKVLFLCKISIRRPQACCVCIPPFSADAVVEITLLYPCAMFSFALCECSSKSPFGGK
jgi:hypothetical protein